MLHDAPQAVSMGSDQDSLSLLDLRNNLFVPERKSPGNGVLKAFTAGELVLCQISVTPVLSENKRVGNVSNISTTRADSYTSGSVFLGRHLADFLIKGMLLIHGWWRNIKGAPPDLDLSFSVFGSCFSLVQARQATIVALIQPPGPVDGQPHLVDAVQNKPQGADGSLKDGGVAKIKLVASI